MLVGLPFGIRYAMPTISSLHSQTKHVDILSKSDQELSVAKKEFSVFQFSSVKIFLNVPYDKTPNCWRLAMSVFVPSLYANFMHVPLF